MTIAGFLFLDCLRGLRASVQVRSIFHLQDKQVVSVPTLRGSKSEALAQPCLPTWQATNLNVKVIVEQPLSSYMFKYLPMASIIEEADYKKAERDREGREEGP